MFKVTEGHLIFSYLRTRPPLSLGGSEPSACPGREPLRFPHPFETTSFLLDRLTLQLDMVIQNISTMQLKHRSPVHAFSHDGATGFDQSVVEIVPTTYQIV